MGSRPEPLDPEEADDPEVAALLADARTGWYGDTAFFGAMAHRPELFRRIVETFEAFGRGDDVDDELLELMRLKIAERHRCAYCATVRTIAVGDEVAPKEDAVFGEVDGERLTRREYLAVSLAEQLSTDPHRLADEFFGALREEFSEEAVVELLLFAGLEVGLDRFCIALELQPTEEGPYPEDVTYPLEEPEPRTRRE
ncbi:carboxymuconolactone decarboxylase family protein [Halobaculum sp. EA56]|uniref:carboxymuconolactone decarboxylase family protein n=1 Tax=Halobaculum sp. EA56 TaxID=3421648 RepID=UPI003EB70C8E